MSDAWASLAIGILCVLCLGISTSGIARLRKPDLDPRSRTMAALASWAAIAIIGVAIWLIAGSQIPK